MTDPGRTPSEPESRTSPLMSVNPDSQLNEGFFQENFL